MDRLCNAGQIIDLFTVSFVQRSENTFIYYAVSVVQRSENTFICSKCCTEVREYIYMQ